MVAREEIKRLETDILRMMAGNGLSISIEAPTALRELDSLLSEAVKVLRSDSTYCHCKSEPCIMFELTKKFQQAGY